MTYLAQFVNDGRKSAIEYDQVGIFQIITLHETTHFVSK